MMLSRTYDAEALGRGFFESIDVFLFGTVTDEERNGRLLSLLGKTVDTKSYHIDYDLETEEYSLLPTPFGAVPPPDRLRAAKKDITLFLRSDLSSIGATGNDVLVDITGISQPALFFMLKLFFEDVRPQRLFFAYTEPLKYKARELPSSEDVFLLTERFIGLRALPGFIREPTPGKRTTIVLLVGFEGKRAKYVCEALDAKSDDIRVVLGFPGFRPGWQYLAYGSNQSLFEYYQAQRFVSLAAANDPFEAYNALGDIHTNEVASGTGAELVLAPVGTKPHSVGAALFALRHSEATRLIYDFPVKARGYRTEGCGTTWVYNLSAFVRSE